MGGLRLTTVIAIALWLCDDRKKVLGSNDVDGQSLLSPVRAVDADVWRKRTPRLAATQDLPCERPQIYICEETPDAVSPEAHKTCDYRSQRYPEQVYRWVAGRGCLLYTPDFLFVGGNNSINMNAGCFYGTWFAPCLELPKEDGTCGCYPFDPGLEEVAAAVRQAMLPAAHGRWERCFYTAADCCSHYMHDTNNYTDADTEYFVHTENDADVNHYCNATFDGWTCFLQTQNDTVATEVCSEFAYSGQGPSCNHYSTKRCFANGTWELQTDYTTCSITPRLLRRYRFYIAVLGFSIVSCLPAIFVFFFYKRLRNNTRVVLHRNLLIIIIIKNILVIVSRSEIYIDELTNPGETVMSTHGTVCRVLAFAERFSINAVFVCMLVEGVYLHRTIVAIFRNKLSINSLYIVGAFITIIPAIAWAVVMSIYDDHSCWLVYTTEHIQWILDAPRVAILLINTILFIDVLRVLLTKVRNSENANQLNTAKATLFLMPIFGVQFLLTAFRPSTDNCTGEQIYYYVSYSVESLQGFIVAMLYCYVNKEVHMLVMATYKKAETALRRDTNYPKVTYPGNERKMTISTAVSTNPDGMKDNNTVLSSKIHVAEIISIQASERLAEILEPMYETIDGITNEGYDSLERSEADDDSGFIPNRTKDDYYGFINASSISIDCQDWIQTSSPSSIYDDTQDYYRDAFDSPVRRQPAMGQLREVEDEHRISGLSTESFGVLTESPEYSERQDMLDEIIKTMENIGNSIILDPKLLSPNRNLEERILFVDDSNFSSMETVYPTVSEPEMSRRRSELDAAASRKNSESKSA